MARFTGDELVYQTPGFESETDFPSLMDGIDKDTSCVVVQYPEILGRIKDLNAIADKAYEVGALMVAVVTEPVAFGAITAPGEKGADIVGGEGQSMGVGLQIGGLYMGVLVTQNNNEVGKPK